MMVSLTQMPQPVIARVHGIATAAGCQLVSMCDLAVAAHTARSRCRASRETGRRPLVTLLDCKSVQNILRRAGVHPSALDAVMCSARRPCLNSKRNAYKKDV